LLSECNQIKPTSTHAYSIALLPLERLNAVTIHGVSKIGGKLVLITNRKSYYELSIGTKIGDLE